MAVFFISANLKHCFRVTRWLLQTTTTPSDVPPASVTKAQMTTVKKTPFVCHLLFTLGRQRQRYVLHTHFTLLYLRGGLCWDWGLACRRSTAIFTSENKSIQTLNTTVTCESVYAFTENGIATSTTIQMKMSSNIQAWKSKMESKCRKSVESTWR